MIKEHLLHFFPFLKKEFRTLDKKEITSEEIFKELFPEEKHFDSYKLKAIYEFQNCKDVKQYVVQNPEFVVATKKVKKNGKV